MPDQPIENKPNEYVQTGEVAQPNRTPPNGTKEPNYFIPTRLPAERLQAIEAIPQDKAVKLLRQAEWKPSRTIQRRIETTDSKLLEIVESPEDMDALLGRAEIKPGVGNTHRFFPHKIACDGRELLENMQAKGIGGEAIQTALAKLNAGDRVATIPPTNGPTT